MTPLSRRLLGSTRGRRRSLGFMWRDLFELNIALREASRIYTDPAIFSAIEKIERTTSVTVQVELTTSEALIDQVERAIETHSQIKIDYASAESDESHTRAIEPREMKVLNGHYLCAGVQHVARGMANVSGGPDPGRAGDVACAGAPRRSRLELAHQVGEEGDEVVVVVEPENRCSLSLSRVRCGGLWRTGVTRLSSASAKVAFSTTSCCAPDPAPWS